MCIFSYFFEVQLIYNIELVLGIQQYDSVEYIYVCMGFCGGPVVKNPPANAGDMGLSPGLGRPLDKEMATHSSILVWEILGTEESGGLQSMGSQRINHT